MKRTFTWDKQNPLFVLLLILGTAFCADAQNISRATPITTMVSIDPGTGTDQLALLSTENPYAFSIKSQTTADDVSFAPDNGEGTNPTLIPVDQVFTITFSGALYTYVNSVPDNNIQVDETYLKACFSLTDTDNNTDLDFTVSLTTWSSGSTVVTITPTDPLTDNTHFSIVIVDDKLQIGQRNEHPLGNGDFIYDTYAENDYVTEDKSPPVLDIDADTGIWEDGYYPGSGETILLSDSLQLDFDEPVTAGTGNVYIYTWNGILVQTIDASALTNDPDDPSIIIVGKVDGLTEGEDYYATMDPGAVVDLSGNPFAGIDEEDDWSFTVRADLVPDLVSYSPTGGNISTEADLVIEYDMPVELGSAGVVNIYLEDGTLVQSLDVVNDAFYFTIIDNKVYIEIDDLDPATSYKVSVEAGTFISSSGQAAAGISADDWQFETEYNEEPLLVSLDPEDDSVDVPLDQIFVMEFNMDMQAGSGVLELHIHDGQNTTVVTLAATDDRVSISGNLVSVDLTGLTVSGTEYYIIVYPDFVQNTTYTPESFAGITKVFNWNFTTSDDDTELQVLALSPDEEVIPDNHPNLSLTFNKPVSLSDQGGYVYVYKVGDTTPTLTIALTSDMFDNNVVNVAYDAAVTGGLEVNTDYYVVVDAGAIEDAGGNTYGGISDTSEWTFTTGSDYALGTDDDLASNDELLIYPNPFDDVIYISNATNVSRLYVTNVAGQKIKEITKPEGVIYTSDLRNGVYIVTLLSDNNETISTRTIVKR
jgi:hypothetical protein